MSSIFVSIISQDECLLEQTVSSAISNSSSKNEIHFSIIEQSQKSIFHDLSKYKNINRVKITSPPRGVGVSRNESIKLYSGQEYILVIDSHTVFQKAWDEKLIRHLNYIEKIEGDKCIISQRLFGGRLVDGLLVSDKMQNPSIPYFDGITIKSRPSSGNDYDEHYALSCHFIFCRPEPLVSVQFEPDVYYLAEEPLLSLRLSTRGYRFFAIDYVPMISLNKVEFDILDGWRENIDPARMSEDFEILFNCLSGNIIGFHGAPTTESLETFINNSGIDIDVLFKNLCLPNSSDSIKSVKKMINNLFSENDFNSSVLTVMQVSSRNN